MYQRARNEIAAPATIMDVQPVVYVVDDDFSVRGVLEGLIRKAGWQTFVFSSAREFLTRQRCSGPSCLILDVALPDFNDRELQEQIVGVRMDMPIIFLIDRDDVPMTVRTMTAGAVEFLTKPCDGEALLETIGGALERSTIALRTAATLRMLEDRYATLSSREREVMALVVSGLMNKQVGSKLGISEITVKAHRGRVMRKMKARSFAELVNIALKLGIGQ